MSTELTQEPSFADAFTSAANGETTTVEAPVNQEPEIVTINDVETPEIVTEAPIETAVVETQTEVVAEESTIVELSSEPTTKEVIKEVEKIVEKYPEFKSEKAKAIYESILASDDDNAEKLFYDYLREKNRDYKVMSDIDVVKTAIEKANPQWNKADIDLELKSKYGDELIKIDLSAIDKELDPSEYDDAVKHNKLVDANLNLIARDARDNRYQLINDQKSLELPKIEKQATSTQVMQEPTAEEIAENKRTWDARVEEQTKDGLRDFKIKIGDKDFAYKFTDEERASVVNETKDFNFNEFALKRGWIDAEGNSNALKLAEDVQKLNNFEKIIKAFATQSKTQGTKEAIKDIKNITPTSTAAPISAVSFTDAFEEAIAKSRN